ncbi:MAG: hypothetical protein NTY83_02035 [Candidatus Micrarchaeota archaeon]|nr:hypothetical protein [Candidatus Micrarchaeota archaeon]
MKRLVFLACLMLLLVAPVAFAQSDSGWDTSGNGSSTSCCCGTAFILLAGAALFTYAHQKN